MKLLKILSFGIIFTMLSTVNTYALWWQPHTVDCTASNTITFEIEGGIIVTHTETWDGIKKVCRDGSEWCWGSDCA